MNPRHAAALPLLWIAVATFALYVMLSLYSGAKSVVRGAARIWALLFDPVAFGANERDRIAVRMAFNELKANGWNLESEEGQKMIYAGAVAHLLDAVHEYNCRWDVRFTRWLRGLRPRKGT